MSRHTLATSTDVERAFSSGRLTVSQLRHSLSDETIRAGTLLGSWARIPGIVDEWLAASLIKENMSGKTAVPKEVITINDSDDNSDSNRTATPSRSSGKAPTKRAAGGSSQVSASAKSASSSRKPTAKASKGRSKGKERAA